VVDYLYGLGGVGTTAISKYWGNASASLRRRGRSWVIGSGWRGPGACSRPGPRWHHGCAQ
jgi:hypothetical protein